MAGWATAISAGPPDEAGQVLTFQVNVTGTTGNLAFDAAPAVNATSGDLSFTSTADTAGVATVSVVLMDDGGTANGGVDTSPAQTFTITVTGINDPPVFTAGPDQTIDEDAGAQSVAAWATGIDDGDGDVVQMLTFMVSNDNAALFATAPAVSPTGTLTYTPADDANGVANVSLFLMDDGGTANGGMDSSPTQMFTITVNAINDPPVNTVPATRSGDEDTVIDFTGANLISVADVDIAAGTLTTDLAVLNGTLNLTAAGTAMLTGNGTGNAQVNGSLADVNATLASLTYTPTPDYNGSDSLTVSSNDNGSTGAGGPQGDTDVVNISVNPINDPPVNTVPGMQTVAGGMLEFSTTNGNAVSVIDIDADPGNMQVDLSVTAGTLSAIPTAGVTIVGNASANVRLTGLQSDVNTALDGLTYVPAGAGADTLTVLTDDLGNTGAPGPLTDSDTVTIFIDAAPFVSSTTPAQGGTIASNGTARIDISEQVDLANGGIVLNCVPSGANFVQGPVANDNTFGYVGFGQPGDDCTITVTSTLMTDVDTIDPPDQLDGNNDGDGMDGDVDDFVLSYSIDAAPVVTATSPMNGGDVANNAVFVATFSEPVDLAMGGFTLFCGGPIAVTPSGSGTNTLTFTPVAPLPNGSNCTATLLAASITDSDSFDPPDNLPADVVVNFDVDGPPVLQTRLPANGAMQVSTTTTVEFEFNEPVDAGAGAITLDCGGPIAGTLSGSGTLTLVFTSAAALPEATACTATAVAAAITDSDSLDPPDNIPADIVTMFTTDAAPTVVTTVPANGALLQAPTGTITVNFSESVNFDTTANAANTSFDLECPAATPANFTVTTASPAMSVVLDPDDLAIAGETCTLTVRAAGISDVDAGDPPDNLTADVVVTIEYDDPAVAVDDSYNVTPHLLLSIGAAAPQGGGVLGNDTLGGSNVITGFGPAGNCNLVAPNGSNAAASTAGGRVVLDTDGSFVYGPPAALVDNALPTPEDTFCYTLTGGIVGTVELNLALTELVWFVDAAYAGANGPSDGTQARPHVNLPAVAAVDTANDVIHIAANASSYTGITLEANQRVVGAGSGSDLATISGIMPVAGSSFPALGGTRPTIAGTGFTLAMNNTIRGLNVGNTGNSGVFAPAAFGTLTMSEASIVGTGRAINFNGSGTANLTLDEITSSSGGFNGIIMSGVGGTINVGAGGTNVGGTTGGDAIFIQSAPAATNFSFGATTVSGTGAGGITLNANNAGATIGFASLSVMTSNGHGLVASGGSVNIGGAMNTITATGGPAISVSGINTGPGWTFSNLSSTNSATTGINLNNITGNINATGGNISGSTGTAFLAQGTLGATSYAGSISKTSAGRLVDIGAGASGTLTLSGDLSCTANCSSGAGNHGLRITNRTAGSITLSGANKIFRPNPAPANTMWLLENNTGATINVSGGTALGIIGTPLLGPAYVFSGGGTINLSGNMEGRTLGARLIDIDGVTLSGSPGIGGFFTDGALGTGVPAIEITNSAAPAGITFASPIRLDNDDAGESGGGIRLVNNTGTYSFPNIGISGTGITSTDTTALFASNAGTINVGNLSTANFATNGGPVIDVQNTTVGTGGIIATSVTSLGGVNGIILNNTGTNPALTVQGGGTPGSGGTISNKTGDGMRLESTQGVTLNFVNFSNTASTNGPGPCGNNVTGNTGCNAAIDMLAVSGITLNGLSITGDPQYGINGNGVAGFMLDNSTINGAGNEVQEDGVRFINLTGNSLIRNTTLQNSHDNHLRIYNTVATALNLIVEESVPGSSRFLSTVVNDGIQFEGLNSANMTLNVSGTDFDSSVGDHIQSSIDDNATMDITIQNNTMTATNPAVLGSGITLSSSGDYTGSKTFNISGNTINDANAKAINVNLGTSSGTGTYSGRVQNNTMGTVGNLLSGGFGIDIVGNGSGTLTALVDGNTVRQFDGDHAIRVLHRDGNGRVNATVTNNTLTTPDNGAFNGLSANAGAAGTDTGTVCLELNGNTMAGTGSGGGSGTDFRLRQRFGTTYLLRGYTGLAGDTAAVVSYVQGINPGGETGSATVDGTGFVNTPGGAACPQP